MEDISSKCTPSFYWWMKLLLAKMLLSNFFYQKKKKASKKGMKIKFWLQNCYFNKTFILLHPPFHKLACCKKSCNATNVKDLPKLGPIVDYNHCTYIKQKLTEVIKKWISAVGAGKSQSQNCCLVQEASHWIQQNWFLWEQRHNLIHKCKWHDVDLWKCKQFWIDVDTSVL